MSPPSEFVFCKGASARAWIREDLAALGSEPFWQPLTALPDAKGRGGVGTLVVGHVELVVRPFKRGGALGSLLKDRYLRPSRVHHELQVLAALRREGVPVVVPVAALARRKGAFWQLRLCTERLPDALPVPAFLAAFPSLRRFAVQAVGVVVRLAFAAGLRHPDLHLNNVLCVARGDKVRAVLVDLDRATVRQAVSDAERDTMLVRLQRHLVRHRTRLAAVPTRAETFRFLRALGLDRPSRRLLVPRLRKALQRQLRQRAWLSRQA